MILVCISLIISDAGIFSCACWPPACLSSSSWERRRRCLGAPDSAGQKVSSFLLPTVSSHRTGHFSGRSDEGERVSRGAPEPVGPRPGAGGGRLHSFRGEKGGDLSGEALATSHAGGRGCREQTPRDTRQLPPFRDPEATGAGRAGVRGEAGQRWSRWVEGPRAGWEQDQDSSQTLPGSET